MKYVTFIIAVDVPEDLLNEVLKEHRKTMKGYGKFDIEVEEELVKRQIEEDNGFHIIGTMGTSHEVS